MRLAHVVGARPQFIKAAMVSRALDRRTGVEQFIVHTNQHFDRNMDAIFFEELELPPPDYNLNLGRRDRSVAPDEMAVPIRRVLEKIAPDLILVFGDTNTTLAGALAAADLGLPVGHVEAGLRSFNLDMPEEFNRVWTDRLSSLLFAPTTTATGNLTAEGFAETDIHLVGDVMFDASLHFLKQAREKSGILDALALDQRGYVLATAHRAGNTDNPARLDVIMKAIAIVAESVPVVWPVHPRTRAAIERNGWNEPAPAGLRMIDPVGYLDMIRLEMDALVIATDSGGVQKEAFFHRVPCVTLREETEWTELVAMGWNRLAPPVDPKTVADMVLSAVGTAGDEGLPYGDGRAAELIADLLLATR